MLAMLIAFPVWAIALALIAVAAVLLRMRKE